MKVTGEQVKAAALAANIRLIEHHACGGCGWMVYYDVDEAGELFFNPGCDCCYTPAEHRTWDSAADWINTQNEEWSAKIAAKFGFPPSGGEKHE